MRILITNDDGIFAPGLKLLAKKALRYGEVIIVAPEFEQSAKSHAIAIRRGLKYQKIADLVLGIKTYMLDSTPADCVRFARYFLNDDFDIVFSGINNGYNLGEDILYSGTVAAASEGVLAKAKAIAFSCTYNNFSEIEAHFDEVMSYILNRNLLGMHSLYNVNVPLNTKGIKITHQGNTNFDTRLEAIDDLVWQKGHPQFELDTQITSDVNAVINNYISITPLTVNRTDLRIYNIIK